MGGLLPPLPAPLPAPAPAPGPVRIGGQIKAPALLHRVEPVYPDVAVLAKLTGVVVLEATVGVDGKVMAVRVLQSRGPLDRAAIDSVKQWQYSPLVLNGGMFLTEIVAGLAAGSAALQADAVDFLSDAANYGISLSALGLALVWRARAALVKGVSMSLGPTGCSFGTLGRETIL